MTLDRILEILMCAAIIVFIGAGGWCLWDLRRERWESKRLAMIERQAREAAENRHL